LCAEYVTTEIIEIPLDTVQPLCYADSVMANNKRRNLCKKITVSKKYPDHNGKTWQVRKHTNQELLTDSLNRRGYIKLNVSLRIMDYTHKNRSIPMGWKGSSSMMLTFNSMAEAQEFHDKLTSLCGRKL
jgi:hypothetical protein